MTPGLNSIGNNVDNGVMPLLTLLVAEYTHVEVGTEVYHVLIG